MRKPPPDRTNRRCGTTFMDILVRLPNWLGDLTMSSAFIAELSKIYPGSGIDVIVKKEIKDIVNYFHGVSRIYEFSETRDKGLSGCIKFGLKIRHARKYDLFFCLPDSFSSALTGFCTGSRVRVGYKKEFRDFLLTNSYSRTSGKHRVEEQLYLLEKYSGAAITGPKVVLKNNFAGGSRLLPGGRNLILNINSEADSRRIPVRKAKELIELIKKNSAFNIILTGGKNEIEHVTSLENSLTDKERVYNFAGKTDINDLVRLINEADLIISSDSGIAHVSNSLGKKTIVLFGAGDERNTRPFNACNLTVLRKENLSCAPCVSNSCKPKHLKCLTEFDAAGILKAMESDAGPA